MLHVCSFLNREYVILKGILSYLFIVYGLTETTGGVIGSPVGNTKFKAKTGSIGLPLFNSQAKVRSTY